MFKLVLENAEEPEIKLPTSAGSSKKQDFQKNIYLCFIDYVKAFDCMNHNKLWKLLKEMGIPDHLICLLRNLYPGQEATVKTGHRTTAAAAAAKSLQSCLTLCDPIDGSLPGSPIPGILQARILKWFAIPFSSGPHSVRPLHHEPSVLGGPTWHGSVSLREKATVHVIRLADL